VCVCVCERERERERERENVAVSVSSICNDCHQASITDVKHSSFLGIDISSTRLHFLLRFAFVAGCLLRRFFCCFSFIVCQVLKGFHHGQTLAYRMSLGPSFQL